MNLDASREDWISAAEACRDQTVRSYTLDDYGDNGLPLRHWDLDDMPPASAWWWFCTTSKPPGHRIVLRDLAAPDLSENLLEDTEEQP